jgi:chorismate synthase
MEAQPESRPRRAPGLLGAESGLLGGGAVEVRPLASAADYDACVELQRLTWGPTYHEIVPASMLKITQRVGGVASGAFTPGGSLVGFVYGVTGTLDGQLVHWSHMLGVHASYRNHGIGRRLKHHQRAVLRDVGVECVYWTFDPLVARNAHLNVNRLGARVVEYVPDMYGDTGSDLHAFGTDRFVVSWETAADREARPAAAVSWRDAPIANARPGETLIVADVDGQPVIRVEIPRDVEAMRHGALDLARAWRASTRQALVAALAQGYEVASFAREDDERCYYVLVRRAA